MKKLYTLLFIPVLSPVSGFTQDFAYSPGLTLDTELVTDTYGDATINVWTPDYSGITFRWNVLENTLPEDWTYSVCDYNSCYVGVPGGGTMTAISSAEMSSGITGFIKFTISPHDIPGLGTVRIWVYDQSNSAIGDTITFNFNHLAYAGVDVETDLPVSVYPNPASGTVFITNDFDQTLDYTITSLSGQLVETGQLAARSNTPVDISNILPGLYLVTIQKDNGETVVRKIAVQ